MVKPKNILLLALVIFTIATATYAKTETILSAGSGSSGRRLYWQYTVDDETGAVVQSTIKLMIYKYSEGTAICQHIWRDATNLYASQSPEGSNWSAAPWYVYFPLQDVADAQEGYEDPADEGFDPTGVDGVADFYDPEKGGFEPTPVDTDADDDGWDDDYENANGSDPNDPDSKPNWNGWELKEATHYPVSEEGPGFTLFEYTDGERTLRTVVTDDGGPLNWAMYDGTSAGSATLNTTGDGWPDQYVPEESSTNYNGTRPLEITTSNTPGTNDASNPGGSGSFGDTQTVTYPGDENRDSSGDASDTSSTTNAVEALRQTNQAIGNDLYQAERATAAEVAANRGVLNSVGRAVEDVTKAVDDNTDAVDGVKGSVDGVKDAVNDVKDSVDGVKDAIDGLSDAMGGIGDGTVGASDPYDGSGIEGAPLALNTPDVIDSIHIDEPNISNPTSVPEYTITIPWVGVLSGSGQMQMTFDLSFYGAYVKPYFDPLIIGLIGLMSGLRVLDELRKF